MPDRPPGRPSDPRARVALETTLLLHGVPRDAAWGLANELAGLILARGAVPALVGVVDGRPVVGLSDEELGRLLSTPPGGVSKLNTANLGVALHRRWSGATTVSATMELAAAAGVRVFATGGLGGVHQGYGARLDISADLAALARFPVAVVASGVKSILDVHATREALETLGVPVVGFRTDRFPAFYQREAEPPTGVDARFDAVGDLAQFIAAELPRARRGVLVCNPIPAGFELPRREWERWLDEARRRAEAAGVSGRDATPFILGAVHELSGGATLRANVELVKANAALAADLARAMAERSG